MAQARNDMRPIAETATVPPMALELTNDGAAASYLPMDQTNHKTTTANLEEDYRKSR